MHTNRIDAGVDVARFFAALLVVAIHARPLQDLGGFPHFLLDGYLTRLAVPFFFAASGYYFMRNRLKRPREPVFRRHVVRLVILYSMWSLVYLPLDLPARLATGEPMGTALLFWLRNYLFLGSHYHLWFFPALIMSLALVRLFDRPGWRTVLFALAFALYLFGMLGDTWQGLLGPGPLRQWYQSPLFVYQIRRNGLYLGLVFVLIGARRARRDQDESCSDKPFVAWFFISLLLLLLEILLAEHAGMRKHDGMYLSLVLCMASGLPLALRLTPSLSEGMARRLRSLSVGLYLSHPLVLTLVHRLAPSLASWWRYLLVTACSLALIVLLQHAPWRALQRLGGN